MRSRVMPRAPPRRGMIYISKSEIIFHLPSLRTYAAAIIRRRKTPSDQKRRHREETASSHSLVCQRDASKTKSGSGVVEYGGNTGRSNNRREIEECDRGELAGGRRGMGTMWGNSTSGTSLSASEAGGDTESSTLCRDYSPSKSPGSSAGPCMGGRVPGWGVTTGQLLRNDSMSSGNRSAVGGQSARSDATEESGAGGAGEEEDSFSFALEGTGAAVSKELRSAQGVPLRGRFDCI